MCEEFKNNVLDLVKQKGFYTYEYISNFQKFKEQLPSKERFTSSIIIIKNSDKGYDNVLNIWNKFEMKTILDYHGLYLKGEVLLLADVFEKFFFF